MLLGCGIYHNEDPKSEVVVGLPHNSLKSLPSLGMNEFLADGSDWHIQSCVWVLTFTRHMRWCVFRYVLKSTDWILQDKVMKKTLLDLQKRFRYTMRVPNIWHIVAAWHSHRTAEHSARIWMKWEQHWLTGNVGQSTASWFSILKISRLVQTMNFILQFLNSGREFMNSVLIFDQSSSRKFFESWPLNSLQFFHLIKTCHMSFRKIPILLWQLFMKK